jgi:uncharacterized membrane protein
MIETLVVVGVVIVITDWYLRYRWWRRRTQGAQSSVAEVLAMRYARGEINRDEYLQKRDDIHACPSLISAKGGSSGAMSQTGPRS